MRSIKLFAVLPVALWAMPAVAQDEAASSGPIDIEANITAVSDYRFRGISLTDIGPAIQPSLTVTHESGLYASVWGSNIASNPGADIEVDLTGGFSKDIGNFSVGLGAVYYLYPGFSSANYVEGFGSVGANVGPGSVKLNVAYAPKQKNIGSQDNLYVGISGELPIKGTPLTAVASFGIEDGAFGNAKRDWSVGLNADVAGFTVGAAYIDTARTGGDRLGKPTVVVTVGRTF